VYLYLQKKKEPSGIREVQRDLELSSPSVAEYQIEKLIEMGLAGRDDHGRAFVAKKVKVKALQPYVSLGRFTVPRLAFYASIFTAIAVLYTVLSAGSLTVYGILVPASAAVIFWFEAWKTWKHDVAERKKKAENINDHFWAALAPGLGALAVFMAASFFLFYYVEPSGLVVTAPPPVDPADSLPSTTSNHLVTIDEYVEMSKSRAADTDNKGLMSDFSPALMTALMFAGALVAGFLVFVLFKYRSDGSVLELEQGQDQEFGTQDYQRSAQ
jgi:hypothetical protein